MNTAEAEIRQLRESPLHDAYIVAWNITNMSGPIDFEDLELLPKTSDVLTVLPELDLDAVIVLATRYARLTHDFEDPHTDHYWSFESDCTAAGEFLNAVIVRRRDFLEPIVDRLLKDPVARYPLLFALSSSYWQEPWPVDTAQLVLRQFVQDGLDLLQPRDAFDTLFVRAKESLKGIARREDRSKDVIQLVAVLLESRCFA